MTDARVLIVEDDVIVAEGLQRALEASGYDVVGHAMQADEAVQLVERWRPDVVLMDVNLEGASEGIDAARTIQRVSDAAIVFVSAYTDEAVLRDAIGTGALGYVVKPFQPSQITSAVAVALHQRRELDRAPRPASDDGVAGITTGDEYSTMLTRLETILFDDEARSSDATDSVPARLGLTPREWDIVRGLVCYRRLPQVADSLGISGSTARNHLKSVFRKLHLHSQDELFRFLLGGSDPERPDPSLNHGPAHRERSSPVKLPAACRRPTSLSSGGPAPRVPGPFRGRRRGAFDVEIYIHDLGLGGCLIESVHEVSPGRRVTLEIDLPGEGPVTVEAEALYQRPGYGFAVKFVDVDPDARAALERCSARW